VAHEAIKTRWQALQVRLAERRERLASVQQRGTQYTGTWDPERFQEAEREFEETTRRLAELGTLLKVDDAARARRDELLEERAVVTDRFERWSMLNDLIGSHDGRKLRVFAQSLTLDAVLGHANRQLQSLAPRYALMRVPGYDLELQIIDKDLGDEIRSVQTLSGGESFLVSLALALGLASLSTRGTHVGTLFIDEGFGTLDPETLETAIYTLDRLRAEGRQIGIISHVENLAERIGSHVRITPRGGGQSMVVVCAA
jgi:exonuclease SbcC